jgi:hypothetical protein
MAGNSWEIGDERAPLAMAYELLDDDKLIRVATQGRRP